MTEPADKTDFPRIERLLEAPVLYCDAVPTLSLRQGIVALTLAVTVGEVVSKANSTEHLLAVAGVRMPMATAVKLHDVLAQMIQAAKAPPVSTN